MAVPVPHEGAHPGWSPREELDAVGQSPDMRHATDREAAEQLRADLDAWLAETYGELSRIVERALARLGATEASR